MNVLCDYLATVSAEWGLSWKLGNLELLDTWQSKIVKVLNLNILQFAW
jgi:hypothetical protein